MSSQPFVTGYQGLFNPGTSTLIASGQQESAAINCGGMALCGIFLPAAFTGTTLTFEASQAIDGTFIAVKNTTSGTSLSYTVAANTYCALDPKDFQGIHFLKIKSGSSEAADRTLILSLKGF